MDQDKSATAPKLQPADGDWPSQIALLLVGGMRLEAVEAYYQQRNLGDPEAIKGLIAEARRRLTIAADYARDEQLGKAISRLEGIYAKSYSGSDMRTALQAQRELNRLLGLHGSGEGAADSSEESRELQRRLDLIASHLLPLKLIDETYPVEEHARIAAETIRRQG